GMDDNRDSDADANGYTHCFMLNPGDCDTTVSACFIPLSGIDGYVWADIDFDGLQDSTETGIDGVDVYLYDALTDTVVSVVQSAGGGLFGFNRVMPGSYYLLFDHSTAPAGYVATLSDANANGSDTIDSDASVQTGRTAVFVLLPGMRASELGAGYYPAPGGLVSGVAWKDCNKNGLREVGEGGLPQTPVQLSGQESNGSAVNVAVQ